MRARGGLFVAMLAAALVLFLPMRMALGWFGLAEAGMTARAVRGSLWSGALDDARFGDIALGDLSARVLPLPLLIGHARIALAGANVTGAVDVTRRKLGLRDVTASLPVGNAFAPVPVTRLDLDAVSVRFAGDACDSAEGRVRAVLAGNIADQALPATMSGVPRCDAGALLLPLTSPAGEGSTIRIWRDGRYRADLVLNPSDPAQTARLQAFGFVRTQQGWQLAIEGRF